MSLTRLVVNQPHLVVAAGALVWRQNESEIEVLLVHSPRYDEWSLPKGKVDANEHLAATAVREVREETGYEIKLQQPLPTALYLLPDGRTKMVRYWAAEATAKPFAGPKNLKEIDQIKWVSLEEAHELLREVTHVQLAALIRLQATNTLQTYALIIQRHAKAVPRTQWDGDEITRPLTFEGKTQAKELKTLFQAFQVAKVISSPWKRCTKTVHPYVKKTGVKLKLRAAFDEVESKKSPKVTKQLTKRLLGKTQNLALCTHRPVLPLIFSVLEKSATPAVKRELPRKDPYLDPGECLIAHVTKEGCVVAIERYASPVH